MSDKLTIKIEDWNDLRIQSLSPLAEFLLFKLHMIAACARGLISMAGVPCDLERISNVTGLSVSQLADFMPELERLELIERSDTGWFVPDMRRKFQISEARRAAGIKGGGSPHLRPDRRVQADLFKQNDNNVISLEQSKGSREDAMERFKKKKEPKKKNNINIYIPEEPYYFEIGCIRLSKRDYLAWREKFSGFSEEEFDDQLRNRADWLDSRPDAEQKRWFVSTQHDLKRRHAAKFGDAA